MREISSSNFPQHPCPEAFSSIQIAITFLCISAMRGDSSCLSWRPDSEWFVRLNGKSKVAMMYLSHILSALSLFVAALHTINPSMRITPNEILKISNMLKELVTGDADEGYSVLSRKQKIQTLIPDAIPFPCDVGMSRSQIRPTNVNQIRPGDIDVVAAIGDSLTTGYGAAATNVLQLAREYRGLSWATGGQGTWRKYLTLPNIIRVFNPNLIGLSKSDKDLQFNTAKIGSTVKDAPYMAQELVKRMKSDERVNVKRDWKLIEVMIGANDFCSEFWFFWEDDFRKSTETVRKYLTMTLDHLRDNLPRTIVNVVVPPAMDSLKVFAGRKGYCNTMHYVLCPCMFAALSTRSYKQNIAMQKIWQKVQEEVAADQRYRRDNFAVIAQPFFKNAVFPSKRENGAYVPDVSFLSEDCFHFSQKTHATVANAVWNNMLEPVGHKTLGWTLPFTKFLCPTEEHPFIFTYENSLNYTKTNKRY